VTRVPLTVTPEFGAGAQHIRIDWNCNRRSSCSDSESVRRCQWLKLRAWRLQWPPSAAARAPPAAAAVISDSPRPASASGNRRHGDVRLGAASESMAPAAGGTASASGRSGRFPSGSSSQAQARHLQSAPRYGFCTSCETLANQHANARPGPPAEMARPHGPPLAPDSVL
jgi:hypothetical protein